MKHEYKELQKLVQEAEQALRKAELYADQHGLTFSFSPEYGMGGTYFPNSQVIHDSYTDREYENTEGGGWKPSSQSC